MRKTYTTAFKAKVVLEVLREEHTLSQIAGKYEIHPNQITRWRKAVVEGILAVWNSISANRDELIADCRAARTVLCDCAAIDAELAELSREIEVVTDLSRKAIHEIACNADDQRVLNKRLNVAAGCATFPLLAGRKPLSFSSVQMIIIKTEAKLQFL